MNHDGLCRLWIYCLLTANWKPKDWTIPGTFTPISIPRGSFICGRKSLHEALYPKTDRREVQTPAESTVWRWLMALKDMGCLKLQNVNNRCTLVSVVKYDTYQPNKKEMRTSNEQPTDNQPTTNEQATRTTKEGKKVIRKEETPAAPVVIPENLNTTVFKETLEEFRQMRKEIRKPMTPTAEKAVLKKLAAWGIDKAVVALEKSTASQWQGVFEPKPEDMPAVAVSRVPTDQDLLDWSPD